MEDPSDDGTGEPPADADVDGVRPVDLRDYVRFSADEAVRIRVFATNHLALDLWCIEPQQATPVLHHPTRDVTYLVIAGRSWFVTDAGEIGLDPMGSMLVAADTVHAIDNRAPDPLIVVAVSSPPSKEAETAPDDTPGVAVRGQLEEIGPLRRAVESLLGTRGTNRSS